MDNINAALSACANFCTAEDIEILMRNEAFGVAVRIHAGFDNELFILPPLPRDKGDDFRLFLGTKEGFPVLLVQWQNGSTSVTEAQLRFVDYYYPLVDSCRKSYVVARTKLKARRHVQRWASSQMADLYRRDIFEHMKWWLEEASRSQRIELGKTICIRHTPQQYLIRLFCGSLTQDALPTAVIKEINEAHGELVRTQQFTAAAHALALKMFGREKWLVRDMGSYVIVAGLDTTSLCEVVQEIVTTRTSIHGAFFHLYKKQISVRFTHEPRAYRSFDQMPDDVRGSLMSSLTPVKGMLEGDARVAPLTPDQAGFLGLPFFSNSEGSRIVSVDGGWIFKCGNGGTDSPVYGQMLMMNKD
jgi:hypothetical protein